MMSRWHAARANAESRSSKLAQRKPMRSDEQGMSTVEMPVEKAMPAPEARRDAGVHYEFVIERGRAERHYWLDLWRYRELFQVLAWRDLSVRYKQTVIGVSWALIRPFLTMLVFTIVFGHIARLPSDGTAPYALMVFAGMLPWTVFATGLAEA